MKEFYKDVNAVCEEFDMTELRHLRCKCGDCDDNCVIKTIRKNKQIWGISEIIMFKDGRVMIERKKHESK